MMRVPRISASMRGTTPGRASGGAYATPLAATLSLQAARSAWPGIMRVILPGGVHVAYPIQHLMGRPIVCMHS